MKNQKGITLLIITIIILAVVLIGGGTVYYYYAIKAQPKPVACTEEAKLCPDGSYVSRTGPDCEFAECPATADQTANNCDVLSKQLSDLINASNNCDSKEDCIAIFRNTNPCFLESYVILDKKSDIATVAQKIDNFGKSKCPSCDFPYLPKKQEDITKLINCVNNKCIIKSDIIAKEHTIQDILLNYKIYTKTKEKLIVEGKNGGWGWVECDTHGVKLGMITESDMLIYDDTGCIYVKGPLYPPDREYLNKEVKIEAVVVSDSKGNPVLDIKSLIYAQE